MTPNDLIDYWYKSAEEDLDTAEILFKQKKYSYCLFFCHLTLEKLLKGLVVKNTQKPALFTHDLVKLMRQAKIDPSEQKENDLAEITTWNIQARYDDIKFAFYKKATEEFTNVWFQKAKEMISWLTNLY